MHQIEKNNQDNSKKMLRFSCHRCCISSILYYVCFSLCPSHTPTKISVIKAVRNAVSFSYSDVKAGQEVNKLKIGIFHIWSPEKKHLSSYAIACLVKFTNMQSQYCCLNYHMGTCRHSYVPALEKWLTKGTVAIRPLKLTLFIFLPEIAPNLSFNKPKTLSSIENPPL